MVIPKTLQLVMLNLFQQLDPKIRFALKNKNPLIAAKSRPWSFVQDHEPVLRKSRRAVYSTLRVQILGYAKIGYNRREVNRQSRFF